jgi:hypothetical protein
VAGGWSSLESSLRSELRVVVVLRVGVQRDLSGRNKKKEDLGGYMIQVGNVGISVID